MKLFCPIMVIAFLPCFLFAQAPFFKQHELGEGFPNTIVELVYEDQNSLLWFGSTEGLFQFDGIDFKLFVKEDSTSNHVRAIYRDGHGKLWVGYQDGGIYFFEKQKLVAWQPEEGTPAVAVTSFLEDNMGRLWFSSYGEGVYYFEGGRIYNFNSEDGLLGEDIYCLSKDGKGNIWAGTDNGISICAVQNGQKQVNNFTKEDGLPDDIVRAILPDRHGNVWVGTYDGGVCKYNMGTGQFEHYQNEWPNSPITCLELFDDKELWVGTANAGIFRYSMDEQHWSKLKVARNAKIFDLHKDIEGNIWTLSYDKGIASANRQFEFIEHHLDNIQAIITDRENNAWVGTPKGVFHYEVDHKGEARFVQHLQQFQLNVISLYQDNFGNILLGTFDKGLIYYQPATGKTRQLMEVNGLSNDNILSIDGVDGRLWLATLGGVTEISCQENPVSGSEISFRKFTQENGLGADFIYKVFVDSKKRVWFGTDGKGVSVLENGTIKNYHVAHHQHEGEPEAADTRLHAVYSITEDKLGNIWLSTDKAGIFEFDGEKFTHLTVKEGIRDLGITSLATDANGQVIIVHPTGIDVLTPSTRHLIYYDKGVGIIDIDPNLNATCTDQFGNVWIGAKNTIIKYFTLKEQLEIHPRALLYNVSIFLEPVDFAAVHTFGHSQNNLVFDFMGLWYTDPEVVKYRYQLEGYDQDWRESKDRQATYSNLPPGSYTFRVAGTENDAWLDEPEATYSFKILPAIWMRWWFIAISLLALASLFYWSLKTRDQRMQRVHLLEKEKAESELAAIKAQINPHFLFNSFNTLINVIEEDKEVGIEYVEKLSDFYRNIMQLRDKDIIPVREEVELVKTYSYLLEKRYGDNFKLNIHLDGLPYYMVPLTLQTLVENAVKHNVISKSKPLTVEIIVQDEDYILIKNSLQRKITTEQSTHFGLHGLTKRYNLLGNKKVKIDESNGEFRVSIPIIK